MAGYYAYLKQHGEGCDYTIGCGTKLIQLLRATNITEAVDQLMEDYAEYFSPEEELESATVFEVNASCDIDVPGVRRMKIAEKEAERLRLLEAGERRLYESLKKKFEGSP